MFGPTKKQLKKQYDRLTSDYRGEVAGRRAAEDLVDCAAVDLANLQARHDKLVALSLQTVEINSQIQLEHIYEAIDFFRAIEVKDGALYEIIEEYLFCGNRAVIEASIKDGVQVAVPR